MAATAQARKAGRPQGAPDTREGCLEAAERLFATQGFAATGLRQIGAASGVSIATLIYHFGSKEKLYGKVLERIADSIAPYMPRPDGFEADLDGVVAMVERFLDWSLDHGDYSALLLRELMENPSRAAKARRWYLLPLIQAYAAAIRTGQEAGRFGPCDPEMVAFYLTGAITHFQASTVTIQQMLAVESREAVVARFRATLRANVTAMLLPVGD
ncbi:TetR family transcriptional regulator [Thalassobaculum sp. OXR-137]|uniref:TetR/AcrR family transcriptional regulator n=1 Tax=Thalassobaculum sp. OXR-137 TaxID=3100173 RepID=UPI002AC89A4A|nr:TetR family transcriptional regulator [Thalassobaculum sp. OXR-137]WPZ33985.1 TetR family transcriptional regulator [Thalassobaculum sp. OXR-137]